MVTFRMRVAKQVIEIHATHDTTRRYCADFITDEEPNTCVSISQMDIECEAQLQGIDTNVFAQRSVSLEISALHRKLSSILIDYQTLMLHAASLSVDGLGYAFVGPSGVGKSTHLFKWLRRIEDSKEINGDKPYIIVGNPPMICGSPWSGKERFHQDMCVPLKAVVILERDKNNHVWKVSASDAYPSLLGQIYVPKDTDKAKKTLKLLRGLVTSVNLYRFKVNNYADDCFDVAYAALCQ